MLRKVGGFTSAVCIWLFLVANDLYWLSIDKKPLFWDLAARFIQSVKIFRALSDPSSDILLRIANAHSYYPPLGTLLASPFYALFGISPDVGIAGANAIFLAILIFSVFAIGSRLRDQKAAVLAAFIVSTYPAIFGSSRTLSIDLALTAVVTLFVYVLLLTRLFTSTKYSIALGIIAGLGMLTKWTFPLFIGGPLICVLWLSLRKGSKKGVVLVNISLFLLLSLLVASLWWAMKFEFIFFDFLPRTSASGIPEGDPQIFTQPVFASLYYIIGLNLQLTFFYFVIFLIVLPLFLVSKIDRNLKISILLWVIIPYWVLTFFVNKSPRYIMPAYPAIAIMSASMLSDLISKIEGKMLKAAFVLVLLSFPAFQFFSISYRVPWLQNGEYVPDTPYQPRLYFLSQTYGCAPHPSELDFQSEEILRVIVQHQRPSGTSKIIVFSEEPAIKSPLQYYSFLRSLDYSIHSVGFLGFSRDDYLEADFILIHDPPNLLLHRADSWKIRGKIENGTRLFGELNAERQDFRLVKEIELPESKLYIYARPLN